MSNRTDFHELACELVEMFRLDPDKGDAVTGKLLQRIEDELHNAYVAGLEHVPSDELRRSIVIDEQPAIKFDGPQMTGWCPSCGADLDELARRGKIGHACFGPGDAIDSDPAS